MSKERAAQLIDAGLWLKLSGDLDGAHKLFERALKLDPENERAKTLLDGSGDAQPVVPDVPPASQPSGISNPFARNEATTVPGAVMEGDWGMQTGFASPTPFSPPSIVPVAPALAISIEPSRTEEVVSITVDDGDSVSASDPNVLAAPVIAPVVMPTTPLGGVTVVLGGEGMDPPKPIMTPPIFVKSSMTPVPMSPAPRATAPQFDERTGSVVISGEPPPQASPPSTPPLYSGAPVVDPSTGLRPGPPNTIRLSGDPAPASPPRSTPPLYNEASPVSPPLAQPIEVDVELPRSSDSAWNWNGPHSSTANPVMSGTNAIQGVAAPWPQSKPPLASPPSPNFSPQTAWDAKSNPGISLGNVVGEGRALELVGNLPVTSSPSSAGARPAAEVKALLRGARDLLDLDDHTGAVELILKAQAIAPDDVEVQALRDRSERTLLAMFESKLGNMNAVPRVLLKDDEIIWLNLDHRAGFVLAQIDGSVSFDDVFAVSGMSRLDTARIIAQLIDEGVISRG